MNRAHCVPSIWTGLVALALIFAAAACQPNAQTEIESSPPSATLTSETDRPQPRPGTPVLALPATTAPVVALPTAASTLPEPTFAADGDAPLPTASASMSSRDPSSLSTEAEKLLALTQKDLARRLSIAEEVILVQSIETVTWPDASLGCAQPDVAYAQVPTPGFRVILEAGGEIYEVHTDMGTITLVCEEPDAGQAPAEKLDGAVQDGWPSQPRDDDVIIVPPPQRKGP